MRQSLADLPFGDSKLQLGIQFLLCTLSQSWQENRLVGSGARPSLILNLPFPQFHVHQLLG